MINIAVMEESFQMIGLGRIPHYIDLFMEKNNKFQEKITKRFKKKDYDSLINLLHKTRGSFSIFHPDKITIVFAETEDLLASEPHNFDTKILNNIIVIYRDFCEELITIRKKYVL
jgi:hypothetical protein